MLKAEEFHVEVEDLGGIKVEVHTYRIGDTYHCHVSSADPGATIARADGKTKYEAIFGAIEKARQRLG